MGAASHGNIPEDCHPRVRSMVDYWESIHPPSGLPARRHFDPIDVPALLSNTGLIEVHQNPLRFKVRLYGTALVAVMEDDYTGRWYHELFEQFEGTEQYADFRRVVDSGTPHWRRGALRIPVGKDYHLLERVHLPLATDGKSVDMILTFAIFFGRGDPFLKKLGIPEPRR